MKPRGRRVRVRACACMRLRVCAGEGEVRPHEAFLMFQLEVCTATAGPGEEKCRTERRSPLMISFPLWPPASPTGDHVLLSNEAQHWFWKPPTSGVQPACFQGSQAEAPVWEPCTLCTCFQEVKGWWLCCTTDSGLI